MPTRADRLVNAAQRADRLPRPPGVRLKALARQPNERFAETSVAVNPLDARHVIASYFKMLDDDSLVTPGAHVTMHVSWSADGGETWAPAAMADDTGFNGRVNPGFNGRVAIDLQGCAFLTWLTGKSGKRGIYVRRSPDGGRTWDPAVCLEENPPPVEAWSGGKDEESTSEPSRDPRTSRHVEVPNIVADNHPDSPYAGNLYVGWTKIGPLLPKVSEVWTTEVKFARSRDAGKTWSEPIVLSGQPDEFEAAFDVPVFHAATGRDGAVYACWKDGGAIVLAVSRDGGETFEPPRRVLPAFPAFPHLAVQNFPRACQTPVIAIDPRSSPGRLFIVWPRLDFHNGNLSTSIYSSTSDSGGHTWTVPVRVNDDEPGYNDQVLPFLAVDATDGAAYVVLYDRRDDPNNLLATVTLARSNDGGRTFANYAWSDVQTDPRQAMHGAYIGLAALDGRVYGAWVEHVPTQKAAMLTNCPHYFRAVGPADILIGIADFRRRAILP